MADKEAPFDKAIQESAKAANNTVDLIREGGRAMQQVEDTDHLKVFAALLALRFGGDLIAAAGRRGENHVP